MKKEIIKIDPAEYGLKEQTAKDIQKMFKPMLDQMVALEREYNLIVNKEIGPEAVQMATELLKKYVKVRTGTDKIHKELKRFYLQGGRFVDGWKNAQIMASQGKEDKLADIKNHFEIQETKRLNEIHDKREKQLRQYKPEMDIITGSLGEMSDDVWSIYLTGAKTQFEAEEKAKADEELRLIEEQRKYKLHIDRKNSVMDLWQFMPEENKAADFGEWADDMWDELVNYLQVAEKDETIKQAKIKAKADKLQAENKRLEKEAEAKRKADAKIIADEKELDKKRRPQLDGLWQTMPNKFVGITLTDLSDKAFATIVELAKKAKEEADTIEARKAVDFLRTENETRISKGKADLLQKQIDDDKKKRDKEESDRLAVIESELKKGDKAKIIDLIQDMDALKTKYEFKSKANRLLYHNVGELLTKVITFVLDKSK